MQMPISIPLMFSGIPQHNISRCWIWSENYTVNYNQRYSILGSESSISDMFVVHFSRRFVFWLWIMWNSLSDDWKGVASHGTSFLVIFQSSNDVPEWSVWVWYFRICSLPRNISLIYLFLDSSSYRVHKFDACHGVRISLANK